MQLDFHYYATYCAAALAGYTHEESLEIAYSAQFVDCCSAAFLAKLKAPRNAATTQTQLELADARTDITGLQDITRIWASFHFLPYDLYAHLEEGSLPYKSKFRLLCNVNGVLVAETVELAREKGPEAYGLAMHILADTWAHRYFAGTPSLVLNNTNYCFSEIIKENGVLREKPVRFRHNPSSGDDLEQGFYNNTVFRLSENAIMNLGHGRAGHLPDYSFMRYRYMPAWGNYAVIIKDNPSDYMHAFRQMVYALKYLRGEYDTFELCRYDREAVDPLSDEIMSLLEKRQADASADWKAFAEKLSGQTVEPFDTEKYVPEYIEARGKEKDATVLGKFILTAVRQKSMVTNCIFRSGNLLAGYAVEKKRGWFGRTLSQAEGRRETK